MKIKLTDVEYSVIDTKEKITIADSFVVRQNKIGSGNGEAKLYIGNENLETRKFFGGNGFILNCILLKRDLQKYLDETQAEYLNPEQPYNQKDNLPLLWIERKKKIDELPDIIEFTLAEQTQIAGPRIYIKSQSNSIAYNLIRELSLPNITYISIVKLLNSKGDFLYYFRLFADYFGDVQHPFIITKEEDKIDNIDASLEEKVQLRNARKGQGEYRKKLLDQCPYCPITLISDDRLLIASHIKPWANSNEFEKTDPKNGFMFTPTFDYLFDRGFISFTNDKKIILSPFLSNMTYSKLGISDNKLISQLPIEGRELYLEYHRSNILKR